MLEIETNIIGDIVLRESDESTGIGEIWDFSTYQNMVKDGKSVPKDVLPYLSKFCLNEIKEKSEFVFKSNEESRLENELTKLITRLYYNQEIRDFKVELVDGYFKFYEGDIFLKTMTVLRFERDILSNTKEEDIVTQEEKEAKWIEAAKNSLRFFLEGKNLNREELNLLSKQMITLYKKWRVEEDETLAKLEEIRKRKK